MGRSGVRCLLLLVALVFSASVAHGAEPRRVLLLHSFGPDYSPWGETATSFRAELFKQSQQPIDLYEASVFTARFEKPLEDGPLIDYLNALFAERKLDLIVAIGGPAVNFAQRNRARLFPATPLLMTAVAQQRVVKSLLTANDTTVGLDLDLKEYIANVLRLLPDTKTVDVVVGNSPLEQYWLADLRREYQVFADRVNFIWFNDLSLPEILKKAAKLPPRSVLFYFLFTVDAEGVPHVQGQALAALREVANAPIFGFGDYDLGHGVVGGRQIRPMRSAAAPPTSRFAFWAAKRPAPSRRRRCASALRSMTGASSSAGTSVKTCCRPMPSCVFAARTCGSNITGRSFWSPACCGRRRC